MHAHLQEHRVYRCWGRLVEQDDERRAREVGVRMVGEGHVPGGGVAAPSTGVPKAKAKGKAKAKAEPKQKTVDQRARADTWFKSACVFCLQLCVYDVRLPVLVHCGILVTLRSSRTPTAICLRLLGCSTS